MLRRVRDDAKLLLAGLAALSLVGAAYADEGEKIREYNECRAQEQNELAEKIHHFEYWGGIYLWQGSSIPFMCDSERGLVKASYKDQFSKLLDQVALIPSHGISGVSSEVRHTTCKLFADRKASKALGDVRMPNHSPVQIMVVDEIVGGGSFFLECFVGFEPAVRGFSLR